MQYLFVCGPARSGTSAMVRLLRAHPAIALGAERFAWQLKTGQFQPDLFTRDRFCLDLQPDDSHKRSLSDYYRELHARFDQCRYVGDKLPQLHAHYEHVLRTFPQCRLVYMARDPVEVASSFQGRANQTVERLSRAPMRLRRDRMWPVQRDWRRAIVEWTDAVQRTLALADNPRLFVADYRQLFVDDDMLQRLFSFLELDIHPAVAAAWDESRAQRSRIESQRPVRLTEEQAREVKALTGDHFERLMARA